MRKNHDAIEGEEELRELLGDLKLSIDAWSEARYQRPRTVAARHKSFHWQLALSGALGIFTVAAVATVSFHSGRNPVPAGQSASVQAPAAAAAQKSTAQQDAVAEIAAKIPGIKQIPASLPALGKMVSSEPREEEDLLARVDSEVARETPSAMEPLARLMAEDEAR